MIVPGARAWLLGTFPPGTQLLIAATDPREFTALAEARADPAVAVTTLAPAFAHPALATIPHLVLEGLEDLEDPRALLRSLRNTAPQARLFALVANGAHLGGLAAFVGGTAPARVHPLVESELEPLFAAGGWQLLGVTPLYDPALTAPDAYPAEVGIGALALGIDDAAMYGRIATAAFVVVADGR